MTIHIVWRSYAEGNGSMVCSVHASKQGALSRISAYNGLRKVDPSDAAAIEKAIAGLALEESAWRPHDFWDINEVSFHTSEKEVVD